ncbi:hypothetical protein LENIMA164B_01655 [Lelliottia nimipressuralis]
MRDVIIFWRLIRNALEITGHFSVQNEAYHDVSQACFWYDEDWLKNGLIRFERDIVIRTLRITL